jgi:hypothetical protein
MSALSIYNSEKIDLALAAGLAPGRKVSSVCIASMAPSTQCALVRSDPCLCIVTCTFRSHLALDLAQCAHARIESAWVMSEELSVDIVKIITYRTDRRQRHRRDERTAPCALRSPGRKKKRAKLLYLNCM